MAYIRDIKRTIKTVNTHKKQIQLFSRFCDKK